VPGTRKDLLYYNIGNNLFSRKDYALAEEMYTSALAANARLPEASLNRANTRLAVKAFEGAITDYTIVLQLRPADPQRPKIEEVIRLLRLSLDEEARKRAPANAIARPRAPGFRVCSPGRRATWTSRAEPTWTYLWRPGEQIREPGMPRSA
jgi:tetratricopeptide (TPR) repeat protein